MKFYLKRFSLVFTITLIIAGIIYFIIDDMFGSSISGIAVLIALMTADSALVMLHQKHGQGQPIGNAFRKQLIHKTTLIASLIQIILAYALLGYLKYLYFQATSLLTTASAEQAANIKSQIATVPLFNLMPTPTFIITLIALAAVTWLFTYIIQRIFLREKKFNKKPTRQVSSKA